MDRYRQKHKVIMAQALATLVLIVGFVLAGGTAFVGAAAPEVDESASLRLTSTGVAKSPVRGFARLRLRISEMAGASFRASVEVEGDGLIENGVYAMWLSAPDGNTLLMDTARADEECEVDPTGQADCELVVELRSSLPRAPFDLGTLEGLTIDVREHIIGAQAVTPVLMTGTVTASGLRRFVMTNLPPTVGTNVGSPFGDVPDDQATVRSSSTMTNLPPNVGTNVGSPFGDIPDDQATVRSSSTMTNLPPNVGTNVGSRFGDIPDDQAIVRSSSSPPVVGRNMGSPFDRAEDEERRLEEEEEEQE